MAERPNTGSEELLWQLSALPNESYDPPVEDEEIERYRRGELSDDDRRYFERRLAADERGLERLARAVTRPAEVPSQGPMLKIAASILVAALGVAGLYTYQEPPASGGGDVVIPTYSVTLEGLASRRGATVRTPASATPDSTVRIVARPATTPAPDLEFALYGEGPSGTLLRLPAAASSLRVSRGTAVLEASASTLVGEAPGSHELVLLIGPPDFRAPSSAERGELETLAREHGLRLHSLALQIVDDAG